MDTEERAEAKTYVVAKPLNTTSRRLTPGAPVTDGEDFSPYAFGDLLARKFLVPDGTKAAEKAKRD